MTSKKICILGGTGFIGRHLAAQLTQLNMHIRVITRQRERHRSILVLPNIELIQADAHDIKTLQQVFQNSDVVINLVGILNECSHDGKGFYRVHVELTRKIIDACRHCGIRRLLHMSALNADAANGPSFYLRTKGEAENYAHTFGQTIAVTSFRPSVIFGPEDNFFNQFARLLRRIPVCFPLACARSRLAPIYLGDVVNAFIRALQDKSTYGKKIDLCGPQIYTLKELLEFTARSLGLKRRIISLPDPVARAQAVLMEYLPGQLFSSDNYKSLQIDSTCKTASRPGLVPIEAIVPDYLQKRNNTEQRYSLFRQTARRD